MIEEFTRQEYLNYIKLENYYNAMDAEAIAQEILSEEEYALLTPDDFNTIVETFSEDHDITIGDYYQYESIIRNVIEGKKRGN